MAKSLGAESVVDQGDFQLIIGQVNGTCEAKEERMKKYLSKVKHLIKKFKEDSFLQVLREENMEANVLAKEVSADGSVNELDEGACRKIKLCIEGSSRRSMQKPFRSKSTHP